MMIYTNICRKEGLYLLLENEDVVDISKESVKQLADEFWNDSEKRPPGIRGSEEFKTRDECNRKEHNVYTTVEGHKNV